MFEMGTLFLIHDDYPPKAPLPGHGPIQDWLMTPNLLFVNNNFSVVLNLTKNTLRVEELGELGRDLGTSSGSRGAIPSLSELEVPSFSSPIFRFFFFSRFLSFISVVIFVKVVFHSCVCSTTFFCKRRCGHCLVMQITASRIEVGIRNLFYVVS